MRTGREYAIPEEEFKMLRYYFKAIANLLDQAKHRDPNLAEMIPPESILDKARLRDPNFKTGNPENK